MGAVVAGDDVGDSIGTGTDVVGDTVGDPEGATEGEMVGDTDGVVVVGLCVGESVEGASVGANSTHPPDWHVAGHNCAIARSHRVRFPLRNSA